jgi:type III secretion system needle length determinant
MKTDQSSFGLGQMLGTPAGRQDEQPRQGKPQEGDVSRFENLLGKEKVAETQVPAMPTPVAFTFGAPGDAMLRGMVAGVAAPDNQAVGRLIDTIASRVLVGDGSAGGGREVRIEIGQDVFPGLEIRIFEEGGRLVVAFATAKAGDLALLRARSSELATRLKERAGRDVELRFSRREDGAEASEDGASA